VVVTAVLAPVADVAELAVAVDVDPADDGAELAAAAVEGVDAWGPKRVGS
jgi:hypothetical protein